MLSRSSRAVLGSREKAKEMHSALALQPARKAQREADFDLHAVLRTLKEKQITASRATDKKGLDALVLAECGGGNGDDDNAAHANANAVDFQGSKVLFNDNDDEQDDDDDDGGAAKGANEKRNKDKKRKKAEKKEKKEKKEKSKKRKKEDR
jgi:hypothetical protein